MYTYILQYIEISSRILRGLQKFCTQKNCKCQNPDKLCQNINLTCIYTQFIKERVFKNVLPWQLKIEVDCCPC